MLDAPQQLPVLVGFPYFFYEAGFLADEFPDFLELIFILFYFCFSGRNYEKYSGQIMWFLDNPVKNVRKVQEKRQKFLNLDID